MKKPDKRRGRPTKAPVEGARTSLGLRVTAQLKRRLDQAAAHSGRSQSQEAEFRLEQSFDRQDLFTDALTLAFGDQAARLLREILSSDDMRLFAFFAQDPEMDLSLTLSREHGKARVQLTAKGKGGPMTEEEKDELSQMVLAEQKKIDEQNKPRSK